MLQADRETLEATERRLEAAGVPHRAIRESDPPFLGEITAIGVCPERRSKLKRYFSNMKLLQ